MNLSLIDLLIFAASAFFAITFLVRLMHSYRQERIPEVRKQLRRERAQEQDG